MNDELLSQASIDREDNSDDHDLVDVDHDEKSDSESVASDSSCSHLFEGDSFSSLNPRGCEVEENNLQVFSLKTQIEQSGIVSSRDGTQDWEILGNSLATQDENTTIYIENEKVNKDSLEFKEKLMYLYHKILHIVYKNDYDNFKHERREYFSQDLTEKYFTTLKEFYHKMKFNEEKVLHFIFQKLNLLQYVDYIKFDDIDLAYYFLI